MTNSKLNPKITFFHLALVIFQTIAIFWFLNYIYKLTGKVPQNLQNLQNQDLIKSAFLNISIFVMWNVLFAIWTYLLGIYLVIKISYINFIKNQNLGKNKTKRLKLILICAFIIWLFSSQSLFYISFEPVNPSLFWLLTVIINLHLYFQIFCLFLFPKF